MDVQLYVYDLSRDLARTMSQQFLGTQIDAVYHTSLVFDGIEYFFGQGVQTCRAGSTHHGQPMEVIPMGRTDLPIEIVLEYLESLKGVYSEESYDLFLHNCNNFTNDFAMFLVGKGIPGHITSLPQTVLNTPFGQMLRPQLDALMRPITQAPDTPADARPPVRPYGANANTQAPQASSASSPAVGKVHNVTTLAALEVLLLSAKDKCAMIFFTSATCAPCKLVYQPYDDLAAEFSSKCVFIKIDISYAARDINSKYPHVRATPTFLTYLRGTKHSEWSGADPRQIRQNVELLLHSAFPPHPHLSLSVPTLLRHTQRPISYEKIPPLDKLTARMDEFGQDPAVPSIVSFITTRQNRGAIEAPLPSLPQFALFLRNATTAMPVDLLFTALDLLRVTLTDPRVAGFFAEEHKGATGTPATISHILSRVNGLGDKAPYALRLTTLHVACNLFSSPLFVPHLLAPPLSETLIEFLTTALLDEKYPALKASALSLAMNMSCANNKIRMRAHRNTSSPDPFSTAACELEEASQVELLASLLEILGEESEAFSEVKKMALICVGWIAYCAPAEGEVAGLWRVMDGKGTVSRLVEGSKKVKVEERVLVREVRSLLV